MIFPGRMLANAGGITIWKNHQNDSYHLHFVTRGIVVDLLPDDLSALAQVTAGAIEAAAQPEETKDHARRLQILQARISDYVRRERPH
jgi:hypothetical protein